MRTSIVGPLRGSGLVGWGVQATVRVNHPRLQRIARATKVPVAAERAGALVLSLATV